MYGMGNSGSKCSHSDHYDTKDDAEMAAKRMGMKGAHKMSCGGKTVYMPGGSHKDYMDYKDGMSNLPGL